jgi:hypothetical protein
MLSRLGANSKMGQDWFTKYTLAAALHIRPDEVERWIRLGWLKSRKVHTGRLQKEIVDADDFSVFCQKHSREVVGRRLNVERLDFVKDFVFPSSHAGLLMVRESKKERAAYRESANREAHYEIDEDPPEDDLADSA